ncbi:DUF2510 domain-containing protein [Rhodococcus sp. IEGM 1379]|uniref:DUF2510 domain-containing protein n=1 Tax=Rhodococcus sp. IEGM 1379 TaxID=3047086 RepID=UPI0024B74D7A|nr:DUF2510 domain-containing protein [Rhodococcus sp. IEGM 1379]MDI9918276.1 DUF2510 domain-containing protein [Rhodococcus sp. IEGM 1379]
MTQPAGWHPDPEGNNQLRYWDGQQWTSATQPMPEAAPQSEPPSPETPEAVQKRKRTNLIAAAIAGVVIVGFLGYALVGNGGDDNETAAAETTTSKTTTAKPSTTTLTATTTTVPILKPDAVMRDFWVRVDRDGYATMNVNGTYTDAELESAFNEQMRMWKMLKKGDGWFIEINCGDGMNADGGARQANGKFAITNLGAAKTGLSIGGSEFEALPNRAPCPAASAPADAISAEDIVAAVKAAGLPVIDPRPNAGGCASSGCVQMIITDNFSVYQFADQEKANQAASIFPLHYQNGLVFIRYTRDGSNPTDPALIPQVNAVLDQVMAG